MSDTRPRIFVGTMYTGEGDYAQCVDMIKNQVDVVVTHHVISHLKEKEAHNVLWSSWRAVQLHHDLFVKIDADTVLARSDTLLSIYKQFAGNSRVTGLQAPLHDYMTDGLINGLNAFSPRVTFQDTRDELYCDRQVDVGHDVVLRQDDLPSHLVPAGFHCHHATDVQAFHYGLHRMLKGQQHVIDRVAIAWRTHQDQTRAFALAGAAAAGTFKSGKKFNYDDADFLDAYAAYATGVA